MINNIFFPETILNSNLRIEENIEIFKYYLDKNESSFDLSLDFKNKVINQLNEYNWNRYPTNDACAYEKMLAEFLQVDYSNILISSGSALIIYSLLNFYYLQNKRIIIVQPSYTLFDYHCKTYNIKYEKWFLNNDLEYDYENTPKFDSNSVVFIVSPNNPVGNIFSYEKLIEFLEKYPSTLFILDEVYIEFYKKLDSQNLINKYMNLIILRSFSKSFSSASLRIGYALSHKEIILNLKKIMLPFTVNILALSFIKTLINEQNILTKFNKNIDEICNERDSFYQFLNKFDNILHTKKSFGNFLLFKFKSDAIYLKAKDLLIKNGVKVLDVSKLPLLENSLRITIGTKVENDLIKNIIQNLII